MRRPRRRPMCYSAHCLHDGTVLAAYPVRKPIRRVMKRDRLRLDSDGVCQEWAQAGRELGNANYEGRLRFQDIIAANLNTRRAIRSLVVPALADIQAEVTALRQQVDRLELLLGSQGGAQ